jgi:tetratricopeptide (TPR) repeat protein/transcriptional regulator with XRE-family HTH domain
LADRPLISFAQLLRRLRVKAGMTQEELAEAANLSVRSVSDLERGVNLTARRETARLLADALSLAGAERAEFEQAARGRVTADVQPVRAIGPIAGLAAATRTLPRDVVSFTGRESELEWLLAAASRSESSGRAVGIYAIGGMAGIGKTAFAVHAAHRLTPRFPDGQIFLPLHGHTPGQRPVDPAEAIASLLQTAGVAIEQVPQGLEARVRLWRDHLAGKRLLIVLDDAIGHEQVRPLLPGTSGSLVLITSRRHLTALEDAQAMSLDTLPPAEATELLIRLAARLGLERDDPAVAEITRLCGCLPLAVGMLARQLHHHPAWTAADLAADLASARDRLELMQAENLSVAAAFDLSYQDLATDQQRLFRRLGLYPGGDIDAYAAAALTGVDLAAARRFLEALYDQHLLSEPARGRYSLHDLIREHARAAAAADPAAECAAALERLLNYYLHTAGAADGLIPRGPARVPRITVVRPAHAPEFRVRENAVSWMEAERLNLHAAIDHSAVHERPEPAIALPAAMHGYLRGQGYWDQAVLLDRIAASAARQVIDRRMEAAALTNMGQIQILLADYPAAAASLADALRLCHEASDRHGEARALTELSVLHRVTRDFPTAIRAATRALALCRDIGDRPGEAGALIELGAMQRLTGSYPEAVASLTSAQKLCRDIDNKFIEAAAHDHMGGLHRATGEYPAAIASYTRAMQLSRSVGNRHGEALALDNLGNVQQLTGNYSSAETLLNQAIQVYRSTGSRRGEARALSRLAVVRQATAEYAQAAEYLSAALKLCRSLGDHTSEATFLNNMGDVSLQSSAPQQALSYHQKAIVIAARASAEHEEARALEGIGRCHLRNGHTDQAAARLRQALEIYHRIGSPSAGLLETTLREHEM